MALNQRPWTATPLSDGRVLLAGGFEWDPVGRVASISDAVQIYDPSTGTFTLAGRMPTPRIGHAAVLLDDGDVLAMRDKRRVHQKRAACGRPSWSNLVLTLSCSRWCCRS